MKSLPLKIFFVVLLIVGLVLFFQQKSENLCEVYVYSYSSLTSGVGVGKDMQVLFKEKTGCQVHLENIGDARMLLQRLKSEMQIKGQVDADVVLGLDQFSVQQAYALLKWHKWDHLMLPTSQRLHQLNLSVQNLIPFQVFVPFDWSPMTFIYNSSKTQPSQTLQELLTSDLQYSLMDPRSSSPGFQFLVWVYNEFGENMLTQWVQRALMISPSWNTAYGLFVKQQTQVAFSYLTSLAYHWIEEKDKNFQAMVFENGHPYQIEFAGVVADSPRLKTALEFVRFLHLKDMQKLIMMKNYMFPVIEGVEDDTLFADLPHLNIIQNHHLQRSESDYLQAWKQSL